MNREIKFRAWDGEQMIYEGGNTFMGYRHSYQILQSYETVMQFTGLKDKNGVDIYEGDILQVNTKIVVCEDDDFFSENELKDQEITCYVSYTEKFAAFELITIEEDRYLKAWGFYGEEDSEDFHIIGNIHSNPELIK